MSYLGRVLRIVAISLIQKRYKGKNKDKERELSCLHFYKLSVSNCSNSFHRSYQRFYSTDTLASSGRNLRQQPFRCTTALSKSGSLLLELLIIVYPFFIVLAITNKSSSYVLRG